MNVNIEWVAFSFLIREDAYSNHLSCRYADRGFSWNYSVPPVPVVSQIMSPSSPVNYSSFDVIQPTALAASLNFFYQLLLYRTLTVSSFFHFSLDLYTQSVGLLGRGISPSQGHYLQKHRINAYKHPYLECDSNLRSL
jgi:hypothetical protein